MEKLDECARQLLDTTPQVMRFIRAEMRSHRGHDLSVPQFRTLTFINRNPEVSLPISWKIFNNGISFGQASSQAPQPTQELPMWFILVKWNKSVSAGILRAPFFSAWLR